MNFLDNEWTDMKNTVSTDLNNINFNVSSISNLPQNSYNYMNKWATNPIVLMVLVAVIVIYYIIFAFLGKGSSESRMGSENQSAVYLEALLWGLFIVLILMNGASYFFNINIMASLKNMFSTEPEIVVKAENLVKDVGSDIKDVGSDIASDIKDVGSDIASEIDKIKRDISSADGSKSSGSGSKEVFNIPGNKYTYSDAQALCKAYDAELATYEQIEDAYEKGASWCNYGWSANQMAFFPTNKKVWEKLQTIKGHEHDCGREGVNGGYIANPKVRYGVNCYGNKPAISTEESKLMKQQSLFPKSVEDYRLEQQADYYKKNIDNILVSPFNSTTWTKI